jgi:hypothetical protein
MQEPEEAHLQAAKKILRYLQGTINYGVFFPSNDSSSFHTYADADWGRDLDTRRSVSGILHKLGNTTIHWSSKLQPTVSLSSTEAEYRVLTDAAKDIIHFRRMFQELGALSDNPTTLFSDNQSSIKLVKNPVLHARTKHIEIHHHFVREAANAGKLQMEYTPTKTQLADFLTKPLPYRSFVQNRQEAGIIPCPFANLQT